MSCTEWRCNLFGSPSLRYKSQTINEKKATKSQLIKCKQNSTNLSVLQDLFHEYGTWALDNDDSSPLILLHQAAGQMFAKKQVDDTNLEQQLWAMKNCIRWIDMVKLHSGWMDIVGENIHCNDRRYGFEKTKFNVIMLMEKNTPLSLGEANRAFSFRSAISADLEFHFMSKELCGGD